MKYLIATMHKLLQASDVYARVPVYRGTGQSIELKVEQDIKVPLSNLEFESLEAQSSVSDVRNAPDYAGVDTGFVEYTVNGEILGRSMLKTSENIRKKVFPDYLKDVMYSWSKMMQEGMFSGIYGTGHVGGMVVPTALYREYRHRK